MDRTLRVVEYTQQVGRSLKNIRNYNPRTHLHGGLPEKRSRTRSELGDASAVDIDSDAYAGYFMLDMVYSEDGATAYVVVVDGASWNGETSNPNLCKITYANNFTYQSYYNRYYANAVVKNYSVNAWQFNASGWDDGVWYLYLVFPFMAQPYLHALPEVQSNSGTGYYYLIGTVTKTTESETPTYSIHQEHDDGIASVMDYQYTGYFKIIDTSYVDIQPPEEEGGEPIETTVYQVAICDGVTWDGNTSGDCICTVNNAIFTVPCTTLSEESESGTCYYYLHYTAQTTATPEGETEPVTTPANVVLESGTSLPSGDTTNAYYLIGSKTNGVITQSHASGVPVVKWYMICPST